MFADTMLRGHEVPEQELPRAVNELTAWASEPGWSLYLATIDGEPAAAAVLQVRNGLGYLANMATLPAVPRPRMPAPAPRAFAPQTPPTPAATWWRPRPPWDRPASATSSGRACSPGFTIATWRLGPHPPTGV